VLVEVEGIKQSVLIALLLSNHGGDLLFRSAGITTFESRFSSIRFGGKMVSTWRQAMRFSVRATVIFAALTGVLPSVAAAAEQSVGVDAEHNTTAISESMYVRIGGIEQWIQIRGDDRANPVLLWVNGGPGGSTMPDAPVYRSWERMFTVVMWDQRGEGKTFEKNGELEAGSMTVDRMSSDGIEITEFLRKRLRKNKIILLGHSWGSILGIHMINSRPELFAAYVGTGQVTHLPRQFEAAYPLLIVRAKSNSQAEQELTSLGPPPWKADAAYEMVNKWAAVFEPLPAPPSQEDRRTWMRSPRPQTPAYVQAGMQFSNRVLSDAIEKEDLPAFATDFSVPVIFIQGSDDLLTTTSVVRSYFNQIVSRDKRFIELPAAGHLAIFRDRDQFLAQLVTQVRPLATKAPYIRPAGTL
jgi:pimeloyl-ACP methyl ester carboxylesterase